MAEFHWPDLRQLFSLSEDASSEVLANMIKDNPHIIVWYFHQRTEAFVKHWLYNYLGATWYWFCFEFAALRGSVHCHGLAKLKTDPGLIDLTKTAVEGHIANDIREKSDLDINDYQLLDLDISNGIEAETVICEYVC